MRSVVVLYLAFATAVGPWPCCCSAPSGSHPPTAAGTTPPPTCCHGGRPRATEEPPAPTRATAGKARSGEHAPSTPCPCDRNCCAVKGRPDQSRPTTASTQTLEPPPAVGAWVPTWPAVTATPGGCAFSSDRPFLSAADRLYAHHVLRC